MNYKTVLPIAALLLFFFIPTMAKGTVSIVDDTGNEVRLSHPAQRIVPLYAALGEILVDLGLASRIVAKTNTDEASGNVVLIGTHMRPNLELLLAQKPDLVLQFEGRNESALLAESLRKLNIPIARFKIASFSDLFSCIQRIAILTGTEEEAANFITEQKEQIVALQATHAPDGERPTVFFEVRYPNLLGAGKNNIVHDIIHIAGGKNSLVSYPEKFVRLNEETLLSCNPDIYLYQEGIMNKTPISPLDRANFSVLTTVKNNTVFIVDESLFSRPGPQSILAAKQLAAIVKEWQKTQAQKNSHH